MYENTVNALRCYAKDEECHRCKYFSEACCDIDRMLFDAADAIEKLELYCDLYRECGEKLMEAMRRIKEDNT